jgi:hypothetical protein
MGPPEAASAKPSSTVVLTRSITRKTTNTHVRQMIPSAEVAKGALEGEFADSTTCRRAMLTRHAVVPKAMLCHYGSSAGMAVDHCCPGFVRPV